MSEFFKLVYELVGQMVYNIFLFFKTIGASIVKLFFQDVKEYVQIFFAYTSGFSIFQWILAIIFLIILIGIFVAIIWLIVLAIKRMIERRNAKINEDDMLKEIGLLNRQVVDLIEEKDKIMAMKVSQLGLLPGDSEAMYNEKMKLEEAGKSAAAQETRFAKLAAVDLKYKDYVEPEFNNEITLSEFITGYRDFAASRMKLYYDLEIIRRFVAGMATSRILLLEGISGTGKTSLPYSFSRYLNNSATLISIQPSFRDRTELLGYFNEFTKRFNETEFLRSIYEAGFREDPSFVVLDEVNLARIEYYFAEMLSILEMPTPDEWVLDLVPTGWEGDPVRLHDGKITVPTTVWFIGTANNDDSTFTITDKVYDRAIPIEINKRELPFETPDTPPVHVSCNHLEAMFKIAREQYPLTEATRVKLDKLDDYMRTRFKLAFGNRIEKQIEMFVPVYVACGGTELEALDYLICRKILKKFESLNIAYVRDEIKDLIAYMEKSFGKTALTESKQFLQRIQNLF